MTASTHTRPVRSDSLPENKTYTDDGCSLAPKCLECPLPQCRYDVLGGGRRVMNVSARDPAIRLARALGESRVAVAKRFNVSPRTVSRVSMPSEVGV